MKKDKEVTKVIFKKAYDKNFKEWYIVAFLPETTVNRGNVMSYMHVGQHGEASYYYYLSCKPATRKEYLPLKMEMEKLFGYRFKVVKKITRKDQEYAWREIK